MEVSIRDLRLDDAKDVQVCASHSGISATSHVPHPYPENGGAEGFPETSARYVYWKKTVLIMSIPSSTKVKGFSAKESVAMNCRPKDGRRVDFIGLLKKELPVSPLRLLAIKKRRYPDLLSKLAEE